MLFYGDIKSFTKISMRRIIFLIIAALMAVIILDFAFPPPLKRGENYSPLVVDQEGQWVHAFTNDQGRWQFHAEINEIDPSFIQNLILIEDKRFFEHNGVDLIALVRASKSSFGAGRVVSGASTITMQTARLLEPRKRNIGSKIIEMLRAWQIERRLNKQEILSLYLTLAPYGGNIQGVRAASLTWFGKEPRYLTYGEQALLIALPQAPEARRPDRRQHAALQSRLVILQKLEKAGAISNTLLAENHQIKLPTQKKPFPKHAWHLAYELAHSKNPVTAQNHGLNKKGVHHASLDLWTQKRSEALLTDYLKDEDDDAIGALIIVDNRTRQVRALVGSTGLKSKGGWNDMSNIMRSPGSALKPFIYAMAFEDGRLSANTIIEDLPRSFGKYNPENFDRQFRGEVRIREALQHSLNVPAVGALEQVGPARFASFLTMAGVKLVTANEQTQAPGLALALGGAGVTMRDLATLYAGLSNKGRIAPIQFYTSSHLDDGTDIAQKENYFQFVSPRTALSISDILANAPSIKGRVPASLTRNAPQISFKTGTSYGFRDAWSAGYNKDYTVIVWVGRADGAPRPGKTGRNMAAPLLFSLFDMLAQFQQNNIESQDINDVDVAANDSSNLDENNDLFAEDIAEKTVINASLFQSEKAPEIIFPQDGVEVFINKQAESIRGLSLSARGGQGRRQWYVNGHKIKADPLGGQFIWYPEVAGFYTLSVVDEAGSHQKVSVRVRDSV